MEPVSSNQPKNTGYIKGALAATLVSSATSLAASSAAISMKNVSKVSDENKTVLKNLSQDILEKTGLAKKGVKVVDVKEVSIRSILQDGKNAASLFDISQDKEAANAFKEELLGNKLFKKLIDSVATRDKKIATEEVENRVRQLMLQFKLGLNACFLPKANKVILPEDSLRTSVFHEIGHALNANFGTATKQMQKMRGLNTIAPAVILATSLLNKKKQGEERTQEQTPTNPVKKALVKSADFIKDNAILLTTLSFVPTVFEEASASLKTQKELKPFLSSGKLTKDLFKQIKKTNAFGLISYIVVAAGAALACKVAINIKDKAQDKENNVAYKKFEAKNRLNAHQG